MSVSAVSSSLYSTQSVQNKVQQFQQSFQQLGKDLQSGNLSAAQSDFATLQRLQPQNTTASSSSSQNNNPIAQAFSQLSTDLQSGNLSAAQQDYTAIQQALQNKAAQSQATQSQSTQSPNGHTGGSEESEISESLQDTEAAEQISTQSSQAGSRSISVNA